MKRVIKNNYKIIMGVIVGLIISVTSVYAVEAYIESKKVSYDNHNKRVTTKENVQDAIDELYERSGMHQEKWVDPILNGADPVLKDPLIPVDIKPNGEVYYANLNSEWYNYSEKRWANAVILIDNPSNKNYQVGDHIIEDDIESYFVWIPRYQYKIWTLANTEEFTKAIDTNSLSNSKDDTNTSFWKVIGGNSKLIDIKFGNINATPKMEESEAKVGEYYTHPAFTLGSKNLNGIWVGKFETGGTINNIIVKPNVTSLRNEIVKTYFDAAKGYETNLDSHMMKNTEWGAAAYLSHSQYGLGTEPNVNNTSDYKTGYSAAASTNQKIFPGETGLSSDRSKTQPWDSSTGYLASTTGNISGVYDMSGGAGEYVAACVNGSPKNSTFSIDELAKYMEQGYIDSYPEDSGLTTFNKRILGDATGELGPFYVFKENNNTSYGHNSWHNDFANFIEQSSSNTWFIRGYSIAGYRGDLSGYFGISRGDGGSSSNLGFRLVLAM